MGNTYHDSRKTFKNSNILVEQNVFLHSLIGAVVETNSSKTKTETTKFFRDQDRSRSQFWLRDGDRQSSRLRRKNNVINSFFDFLKKSF